MRSIVRRPGFPPTLPLSRAVATDSLVFISGQVGTDDSGQIGESVYAQTRLALSRLNAILESVGSSLSNVLKVTVFLRDLSGYDEMNSAYREFFPSDPPARSCVGTALLNGYLVEVEAIAARNGRSSNAGRKRKKQNYKTSGR